MTRRITWCLYAAALVACTPSHQGIERTQHGDESSVGGGPRAAKQSRVDAPIVPPNGSFSGPLEVHGPRFTADGDTRGASGRRIASLDCLPGADLRGPEVYYRVHVRSRSLLRANINRHFGDPINLDIALLEADGHRCLRGGDVDLRHVVEPGTYLLVVDTWYNTTAAKELSGPYFLEIQLEPPPEPCAMEVRDQLMLWRECSMKLDCHYEEVSSLSMPYLKMPAHGPVVMEAHLVTNEEGYEGGWPSSSRDGIKRHYSVTEEATGYKMRRRGVWAPAGEGINVSRFGEGSAAGYVPAAHEPWYVNMYWAFEPPKATRMILINPGNGRAVVAAAGYEKGPGSSTAVGGATEEIHHHLGTTHRSAMVMGFATDTTLPLGPIDCRQAAE